jgi:hypothetical protein
VAVKAEFGLADKEMSPALFRFAYQDHEGAGPLAEEFAAKMPERNPARLEVMPEAAISRVEKWIATVRYEREKMGWLSWLWSATATQALLSQQYRPKK